MASPTRSPKRQIAEGDDDAFETDAFKEFDGLMKKYDSFEYYDGSIKKYDYFETNFSVPLEEEIVNLLGRHLKLDGDLRKTRSDGQEVQLNPIFLRATPLIENHAKFAVDFYINEKRKDLKFVRHYKANCISMRFGSIFLLTVDTISPPSEKKTFRACVFYKNLERLVWSFKPKTMEAEEVEEVDNHNDAAAADDDGWETESFKAWAGFNWKFFDFRRIPEEEEDIKAMDLVKLHSREVCNSKGFDVRTFPPSRCCWLEPLPDQGPPFRKDVEEAARFAIHVYNEKTGKQLEFVKLSKAFYTVEICIPHSGYLYFITFVALDTKSNEEKTFLSNVYDPKKGLKHVRAFKLKPCH